MASWLPVRGASGVQALDLLGCEGFRVKKGLRV